MAFVRKSMERLSRQAHFLKAVLNEADAARQQQQLQAANKDQINAISEIVANILKKRVPLHPSNHNALFPHRHAMRKMSYRKASLKARRAEMVSQSGKGFYTELNKVYKRIVKASH